MHKGRMEEDEKSLKMAKVGFVQRELTACLPGLQGGYVEDQENNEKFLLSLLILWLGGREGLGRGFIRVLM